MSRASAGEAGFTLVETIVAFAILSLTVTAAIRIAGDGGSRARIAEERAAALVHAQSQLALLGATGELPPGGSDGRFDDGFVWRLAASPRPSEAGAGQALIPFDVRIEVNRPGRPGAKATLATVLLARPAEAP